MPSVISNITCLNDCQLDLDHHGHIVWDYQRGFLRCLSSLNDAPNNPVQNCINYKNQNNLPTIGSEVQLCIDPNHPAFGKSGKLTRAAQLTPLSDQFMFTTGFSSDDMQVVCEDDTESTPEERR